MQAQEKRYNIVIDSSHFPAEQDAAQPVNTIADNQGGAITYKYNEQGQTIITGRTVNQVYYAELGRGVAIKRYDVENSIRLKALDDHIQAISSDIERVGKELQRIPSAESGNILGIL